MTPLERELDAAAQSFARWEMAELLAPVEGDASNARARIVGYAAGRLFAAREHLADRSDRRPR